MRWSRVRMAEQMSMIDNLSKGRLIVGLGRGTAHNIYDYRGYGLAPEEEGHGRRRRSTKVVSEKYIEVLLVIDNSVVNFHGHSLVEQYLVTQMNLVSLSRDVTCMTSFTCQNEMCIVGERGLPSSVARNRNQHCGGRNSRC